MITLSGVIFGYRPHERILNGVSLELEAGLLLVVGPNGAGKSTLLKILAGVEKPDAGNASVGGHDLWREEAAARAELAYVPERADLPPHATVAECLRLVARLRGESVARVEEALVRVGLEGMGGRTVHELSHGQRKRALLAAARIGEPRVLLLDEPLDALDRGGRDELLAWVADRVARGALAVVVTHELKAFAKDATGVVVVGGGLARVESLVGADASTRAARLERLARGG